MMAEQNDVLAWIASAGDRELSEIIHAVLTRYDVLFPDDAVFFLSLPKKDRAEQANILRQTAALIEREE